MYTEVLCCFVLFGGCMVFFVLRFTACGTSSRFGVWGRGVWFPNIICLVLITYKRMCILLFERLLFLQFCSSVTISLLFCLLLQS